MDKESVVYIHNEIVLHLKRKKKTMQLSLDSIMLSEIENDKRANKVDQ